MSTPEDRKQIYRESREKSGLRVASFGRLMALGLKTNSAQPVGHKEKPTGSPGSKGVSKGEALSVQLLCFLQDIGYDIENISFDETGRITSIPKVKNKRKTITK